MLCIYMFVHCRSTMVHYLQCFGPPDTVLTRNCIMLILKVLTYKQKRIQISNGCYNLWTRLSEHILRNLGKHGSWKDLKNANAPLIEALTLCHIAAFAEHTFLDFCTNENNQDVTHNNVCVLSGSKRFTIMINCITWFYKDGIPSDF